MSKKRGAQNELTKDDVDSGEDDMLETAGTWTPADPETLKGRVIYKVKRSGNKAGGAAAVAPKPSFNLLGGDDNSGSAAPAAGDAGKEAAAAPAENAFLKALGRQAGDWDCGVCTLMNKAAATRCISCEEWRPGHKPAAAAEEEQKSADDAGAAADQGGFGFGFGSSDDGAAAGAGEAFSFGDTSNFTLGDVATGGGFSFGSVDGDESMFGQGSGDSLGETASSLEAVGGAGTGAASELFKEGKAEPRGDDADKTIHRVHCKVYKMGPQVQKNEDGSETVVGQSFLEQGQGELRMNVVQASEATANKPTARVLMRADMTHRLIINAPVFEGIKKQLRGDTRLQFISNDLDGSPAVFLLKFGNAEDAKVVDAKFDELVSKIQ